MNDLPTNIYGGVTINSWEPKMRLVSENIYVGRWGLTGEESLSLYLPSSNSETEKRDGRIKLIIQNPKTAPRVIWPRPLKLILTLRSIIAVWRILHEIGYYINA